MPHARDDRGLPLSQPLGPDRAAFRAARLSTQQRRSAFAHRWRARATAGRPVSHRHFLTLVATAVISGTVVLPAAIALDQPVLIVAAILALAAVWLVLLIRRSPSARSHADRLCANPALVPVCAACLYDLEGIPPQEDRCRVCPECGAAWRFARDVPDLGPLPWRRLRQRQKSSAGEQ